MVDEKTPVPTTPSSLKKDVLSEPAEDKMFAVVEEEIAPSPVEEVPVVSAVESAPSDLVEVFENKIIFENKKSKTSMSVWQVQRRLYDLGYEIVREAKPGYYEALTLNAVKAYRADKNLGEGDIDAKFLKSLFAGDKAVKLILA